MDGSSSGPETERAILDSAGLGVGCFWQCPKEHFMDLQWTSDLRIYLSSKVPKEEHIVGQ